VDISKRKNCKSPATSAISPFSPDFFPLNKHREMSADSIASLTGRSSAESINKRPRSATLEKLAKHAVESPVYSKSKLSTTSSFGSAGSSEDVKSKPKKKITFDPRITLLYYCEFPPDGPNSLNIIRQCLQDIKNNENGVLDVNNIYRPQQWLTPLHLACTHGHVEVAELLIKEASAAVNILDKEDWTPLHCAAAEGHIPVIEMLARCQGNIAEPLPWNEKWIYALDGPINLNCKNADGDLPEAVASEAKANEISQKFKGTLFDYKELRNSIPFAYEESQDTTSETSELTDELPENEAIKLIEKDGFVGGLKRTVTKLKTGHHPKKKKENEEIDDLLTSPTVENLSLNPIINETVTVPDIEIPRITLDKNSETSTPSLTIQTNSLEKDDSVEDSSWEHGDSKMLLQHANDTQPDTRKVRRSSSVSRSPLKAGMELETERTAFAGEPKLRTQLKRRLSKTNRDSPRTSFTDESLKLPNPNPQQADKGGSPLERKRTVKELMSIYQNKDKNVLTEGRVI
jgi:hypothetical protein